MSLALYRKYRPATFAELKGQEHVAEPLRQALRSGRINHAYLFSGPRGCGKTSSARILARSLNCERGPTPDPCGVCDSCVALGPGGSGHIDVIEIDAASHGGVDDARDLRERAFFAPVAARFKIYIIDEAHMVTREGFNALLKLVEEPPPHLKFVFATTEPEKVIGTIRSRTHHYPFRLIPPGVLRDLLTEILDTEKVPYEENALPLVVRAGAGSARDSLSILDQLLAGSDDAGITYARAVSLLGYTDSTLLDEVVDAFAQHDGAAVFAAVDRVMESGQDPRRFATDLLGRFRDLVILANVPNAGTSGLLDLPADELDRMQRQAGGLGRGELTRAADLLHTGLTDMRGATSPRLLLELICARILLPGAYGDEASLLARLERLEHSRPAGAYQPPGPQQAAHQQAGRQQPPPPPASRPPAPGPGVPPDSGYVGSGGPGQGSPASGYGGAAGPSASGRGGSGGPGQGSPVGAVGPAEGSSAVGSSGQAYRPSAAGAADQEYGSSGYGSSSGSSGSGSSGYGSAAGGQAESQGSGASGGTARPGQGSASAGGRASGLGSPPSAAAGSGADSSVRGGGAGEVGRPQSVDNTAGDDGWPVAARLGSGGAAPRQQDGPAGRGDSQAGGGRPGSGRPGGGPGGPEGAWQGGDPDRSDSGGYADSRGEPVQGAPYAGQGQGAPYPGQGQGAPHSGQGQGAPYPGQGQGGPQSEPVQGGSYAGQGQGGAVQQGGAGGLDTAAMQRAWPDVLETVKRKNRARWMILQSGVHVVGVEGNVLTLAFDNEGTRKGFAGGGRDAVVREALQEMFGVEWRVDAVPSSSVTNRPPAPPQAYSPPQRQNVPQPAPGGEGGYGGRRQEGPAQGGHGGRGQEGQGGYGGPGQEGHGGPGQGGPGGRGQEGHADQGGSGGGGDGGQGSGPGQGDQARGQGPSGFGGSGQGRDGAPAGPGRGGSASQAPGGSGSPQGQAGGRPGEGTSHPGQGDARAAAQAGAGGAGPQGGPRQGASSAGPRREPSPPPYDLPPPPDEPPPYDESDEVDPGGDAMTGRDAGLSGMALIERELGGQIIREIDNP